MTLHSQAVASGPAERVEVIDAARAILLDRDWDVVLAVTDLPLTEGRRAVLTSCSPVHGVGILSFPALGTLRSRSKPVQLLTGLVMTLVGIDDAATTITTGKIGTGEIGTGEASLGEVGAQRSLRLNGAVRERLQQVAADTPEEAGESDVQYAARVIGGNLGLLAAMVRANRPWRLAVGLSRALSVAGATAVVTLVTTDLWVLADAYGLLRFVLLGTMAVVAVTLTLILGGGLWERSRRRRQRRQVALFNAATMATVLLGVAALFGTLLVLSFLVPCCSSTARSCSGYSAIRRPWAPTCGSRG